MHVIVSCKKSQKHTKRRIITCGGRFERASDWLTPVNRAEHLHVQRHVVDSEWYQVVDRVARCVISTDDLGCCTVLLKIQLAMRLCLADQLRKRLIGALFKSVYVTTIHEKKQYI